jgi:hypothetical protein
VPPSKQVGHQLAPHEPRTSQQQQSHGPSSTHRCRG